MYTGLLHTHSLLRYAILILPAIIIIKLLINKNKILQTTEKKMLLWLTIVVHTQLLIGVLLLYWSPNVQFNGLMMKDSILRYWGLEHGFMMIIAVILITMARVYSKQNIQDRIKRQRVLRLMIAALGIVLIAVSMSGRGIFIPNTL